MVEIDGEIVSVSDKTLSSATSQEKVIFYPGWSGPSGAKSKLDGRENDEEGAIARDKRERGVHTLVLQPRAREKTVRLYS